MDKDFGARLRDRMAELGLRSVDLQRQLGVKQLGTVSRWRSGVIPHDDTLAALAGLLGVRLKWLKTGEGEMLGDGPGSSTPLLVQEPPEPATPPDGDTRFAEGYNAGFGKGFDAGFEKGRQLGGPPDCARSNRMPNF